MRKSPLGHPVVVGVVYPLTVILFVYFVVDMIGKRARLTANLTFSTYVAPELENQELMASLTEVVDLLESAIDSVHTSIESDFEDNSEASPSDADSQLSLDDAKKTNSKAPELAEVLDATRLLGIRIKLRGVTSSTRNLENYRVIWHGTIVNQRGRTATDVRLQVPHGKLVRVTRKGGVTQELPIDELIELGNIQPSEQIEVVVWCDIFAAKYQAKRIALRHDEGRGVVRTKIPLPRSWSKIFNYWPVGIGILTFFASYFGVQWLGSALAARNNANGPSVDSKTETTVASDAEDNASA